MSKLDRIPKEHLRIISNGICDSGRQYFTPRDKLSHSCCLILKGPEYEKIIDSVILVLHVFRNIRNLRLVNGVLSETSLAKLFQYSPAYALEQYNFENAGLTPKLVKTFTSILPNLVEMEISGETKIKEEGFTDLFRTLPRCLKLKILRLERNEISKQNAVLLGESLRGNQNLVELILDREQSIDEGIETILSVLPTTNIKRLCLIQLCFEGVRSLSGLESISIILLVKMIIHPHILSELERVLRTSQRLINFCMDECDLNDNETKVLFQSLRDNNFLEEFSLRQRRVLTHDEFKIFRENTKTHRTLYTVELPGRVFESELLTHLVKLRCRKTQIMVIICSVHSRVGRNSQLRHLPKELFRQLITYI